MRELEKALDRFVRRPRAPRSERCEICGAPIVARHPHVARAEPRTLLCACATCATLFAAPTPGAKLRTVPNRVLVDPRAAMTDADLASLGVPVGLVFIVVDGARDEPAAFYPSPAGPVAAAVAPEAWRAMASKSALFASVLPDVEAVLLYRPRGERVSCFVAPIDACYELTGAVRVSWEGFAGGDEAWETIARFFEALRARALPIEA